MYLPEIHRANMHTERTPREAAQNGAFPVAQRSLAAASADLAPASCASCQLHGGEYGSATGTTTSAHAVRANATGVPTDFEAADATGVSTGFEAANASGVPPGLEPGNTANAQWYAAYTSANHEKRVAVQLRERAVEHFLPVYESLRRWKDRRVRLEMPLFPGYVFVRMDLRNRLKVLQVPGVSKLVGFGGVATALPSEEVEALRVGVAAGIRAEPHPYLTVGRRVRVKSGPLVGMQGVLTRKRSGMRFVVSVELIQRSVALEIDALDLAPF